MEFFEGYGLQMEGCFRTCFSIILHWDKVCTRVLGSLDNDWDNDYTRVLGYGLGLCQEAK